MKPKNLLLLVDQLCLKSQGLCGPVQPAGQSHIHWAWLKAGIAHDAPSLPRPLPLQNVERDFHLEWSVQPVRPLISLCVAMYLSLTDVLV